MKNMKKLLCLALCALFLFGAALPAFAECADDAHEFTATVVPPTCLDEGFVLRVCVNCGKQEKSEFAPATGHTFHEWSVAQQATCVQEGIWERTCVSCNTVETKTKPVLDHSDADADGRCDTCGKEMPIKKVFSPFDWFVGLFRAIAQKLQGLFSFLSK